MARYMQASCKLCRREGVKLFLKGSRCTTGKCSFDRRDSSPGQHGRLRTKLSDYGVQLREKQKVKRIYGILERQFRLYFKKAARTKGVTGHKLLEFLERRLDNAVFRLLFAGTRMQARQMVRHGLIRVNGRKIDIPSYQVKPGDTITIRPGRENVLKAVKEGLEVIKERGVPKWLSLEEKELKGTVTATPDREDVRFPIREQLIVELYSK